MRQDSSKKTRWLAKVLIPSAALAAACGSGAETGGDIDSSSASGSGGSSGAAGGTGGTASDASSTSTSTSDGSSTDTAATSTSATSAGGATGSTTDSNTTTSSTDGTVLDPVALCGGTCQCGNGIDDDGDGKIDGFDEECTGAADNDEGSFATGISGDNKDPKWQDCFFDGNSGAGDDGCRYHTDCLTGALPEDDPDCTVTQECIDFCVQRTPNGCDCFGCCTFDTADGPLSVQIGLSCDYENIDDEVACPRCTPSTQCGNDCGECELCPGKDTLPDTCESDVPQCDNGGQPCDLQTPCDAGYWCTQGCCVPFAVE